MHRPLRLTIDRSAIQSNWRWLQQHAEVPAGAAIKADGYGVGARETLDALYDVGCRDFFVSSWMEAQDLGPVPDDATIAVLHGLAPDDVQACSELTAKPVLISTEQVARWKEFAGARQCDVMIDTAMNRLGLRPEEIGCLDGLNIDTLHSHLACADEENPLNARQLQRFRDAVPQVRARRYSLANSAGIGLGRDFAFDLVRPGISIYGGAQRSELEGNIRQVARVESQIIQRRTILAG